MVKLTNVQWDDASKATNCKVSVEAKQNGTSIKTINDVNVSNPSELDLGSLGTISNSGNIVFSVSKIETQSGKSRTDCSATGTMTVNEPAPVSSTRKIYWGYLKESVTISELDLSMLSGKTEPADIVGVYYSNSLPNITQLMSEYDDDESDELWYFWIAWPSDIDKPVSFFTGNGSADCPMVSYSLTYDNVQYVVKRSTSYLGPDNPEITIKE